MKNSEGKSFGLMKKLEEVSGEDYVESKYGWKVDNVII